VEFILSVVGIDLDLDLEEEEDVVASTIIEEDGTSIGKSTSVSISLSSSSLSEVVLDFDGMASGWFCCRVCRCLRFGCVEVDVGAVGASSSFCGSSFTGIRMTLRFRI